MKRILAFTAVLLLLAAAPMHAAVIEDFSNNADGILAGQPANGPGTTGTWTGDDSDLSVISGVAVYDRPNDYNASRSATASLSSPLDLTTNGVTYYFAADLGAEEAGGTLGVYFNDNAMNNSVPVLLPASYDPADGVVTVVVKWTYNPGGDSTSETYTVWVDPASESDAAVDFGSGGDYTMYNAATALDSITVYGENLAGTPGTIDNIRAGTSFAEVIPEPATMAMLGLGGLAVLIRRRKA